MQIEVYARGLKVLSRRERRGFDAPFMVLGWFFVVWMGCWWTARQFLEPRTLWHAAAAVRFIWYPVVEVRRALYWIPLLRASDSFLLPAFSRYLATFVLLQGLFYTALALYAFWGGEGVRKALATPVVLNNGLLFLLAVLFVTPLTWYRLRWAVITLIDVPSQRILRLSGRAIATQDRLRFDSIQEVRLEQGNGLYRVLVRDDVDDVFEIGRTPSHEQAQELYEILQRIATPKSPENWQEKSENGV
ncbi:hypothetical protein GXSOP10_10925 [Armatimonadetes bacterium GXS]|nr:hypothetical protein GXSOP10_10925 [Armatimonadetes bacterium GXS]